MGSTLKYSNIGMRGVGVGLGDFNRGSLRGHFPLPQTHNHTARNCLYCWQLYTSQQGGRLCDFQIVQAASVSCCKCAVWDSVFMCSPLSGLLGIPCLCFHGQGHRRFNFFASLFRMDLSKLQGKSFRSCFFALGLPTSLSLAFVHYNTIGWESFSSSKLVSRWSQLRYWWN